MHTLRVLIALGPFAVSLFRDHRRWLWWGRKLPRTPAFHARRAQRLVTRIAALGPTFVKLAQVFASRADLIPEPYLSELGTLTDQVPPVPWTQIDATIAAAYGRPVGELFETIDHVPVAAASLGQVHRARWRGRDVAVKVLRPGIEAMVARDLRSARTISAWAARRWPSPHVIGFQALVEEFALRIGEEMDFRLEAEYATEVRANFAGNPRVVIPEVMHEMTRQRVLLLSFIEGVRVDKLVPGSVDAHRLAGLVMEVYVQMMLVDSLFHADPHAGNLLVTPDGRLVLLDFGMMVRVTPAVRLSLIRTVFAAIRRDPKGVATGFADLGLIAPGADPADIAHLSELLVAMSVSKSTTTQRLETMLADRVMRSLYDFPVILPRDLVYFGRTAMLIEGIGTRYDPYFQAIQVGTPIVMRMRSRILNSLGEEADPSLEEIAAIVGWGVGRAWRQMRDYLSPWLGRAATLALAGLIAVSRVEAQVPALWSDSLQTAMETAVREEGFVGATWSLVTPETTVVGAAGLRDASRGTRMRPEDRMQVGSVAKTLLALGVLRLVTDGRVDLDATVASYLERVTIRPAAPEDPPLLVRHLLDHTGGVDDARMWQVFTLRADPDAPLIAGLPLAHGALRLRHAPGERFSYSNTSFLLLGMVIEAVTRERYETFLDRALLAPLGMSRSTFAFVTQRGPSADTSLAMGHFDPQTTSASVANFVRPSSQFTTTAADMARLARFLMSDGVVDGRALVRGELLRAMAVPSTTEAARAGLRAGYALGLARRDRFGVVGNCHLGNIGTFRAILCVYPEQGRGFFLSINTDPESGNFDRVDGTLARALAMPETAPSPVASPGADPGAWEGLYVVRPNRFAQFAYLDELTGITRVAWHGDTLRLEPLQGNDRALIPTGGAFFRATDRRETSHVLLRSAVGRALISDGHRTFEQVSAARVYALWASAVAGVAALLYLLIVGTARSVVALRRRAWFAEPLSLPSLTLMLLVLAPALFLTQSFMAIGDPTPANRAVAAFSGALPLALLVGIVLRLRAGVATTRSRVDLLSLAAALQWCLVLASWGMLPLALWR